MINYTSDVRNYQRYGFSYVGISEFFLNSDKKMASQMRGMLCVMHGST